jgi:Helix-turn-helix domain
MVRISKALRERNAEFQPQLRLVLELEREIIEGLRRMDWWQAVIKSGKLETQAEISVLGVILAHISLGDGGAWPSMTTIATLARCDKRTARKAIAHLTDLGFLAHLPPGKNGRRSKTYIMRFPGGLLERPPAPTKLAKGRPISEFERARLAAQIKQRRHNQPD